MHLYRAWYRQYLVEAVYPWLLVRYAAAADACRLSEASHVAIAQATTGGIEAQVLLGRGGESTGSKAAYASPVVQLHVVFTAGSVAKLSGGGPQMVDRAAAAYTLQ